jgi:hypothetical protein
MSRRFNRNWLALCLGSAVFATPAGACGPFFPNQLLFNGTAAVTWAPVASFDHEIRRILPAASVRAIAPADRQDVYDQSIQIDLADLKAEMEQLPAPTGHAAETLERYQAVRQALAGEGKQRDRADEYGTTRPALRNDLTVPQGLPPQFAGYLHGLIAYSSRHMDEARTAWESVLQLPPEQRRRRSLWAEFMIGKSYLQEDPSKAIEAFHRVRELARSGQKDPLGLAAASLGWEARAELNQRHEAAAIGLYLQQCASGDPTAIQSLAIACGRAFSESDPTQMKELARDPAAARVMTAYAIANGVWSRPSPKQPMVQRWLAAVESAGAEKVIGAERLAWAAYQSGDMTAAQRWAAIAPEDAPIALWVKAKLLLRAGKVDAAAEVFARTIHAFPVDEKWESVPGTYEPEGVIGGPGLLPAKRAAAELGVLELSRGNYVEALDRLLRAGWWIDAAYVAERVLTVDELIAYVDRNWPDAKPSPIRHLLARRLTRVGRWKEARPYFPAELRPKLDEYIAAIRAGHDEKLEAKERGRILWSAARIARRSGMELLGTELAPDDALDGGTYTGVDMADARKKDKEKLLAPTHDELNRAAASAPQPDRRFHYRYIAIDHAWAAAELLPDGSDELAAVLCEAGSWIKDRDPRGANRFYKALVTRCGNTELGRAAADKKWFPDRKSATANAGT